MKPESVLTNEQTLITVDTGEYEVSFKQIAGLLARRIVCNIKVGDRVERGQRIGLIKFGSRVDVLMPAEANLKVKVGSRVIGGSTVLASMPQGEDLLAPATAAVA
jgi:phosphatidylserine decarboxylase